MRILLVDDDDGLRALLRTTFEAVDVELAEAANASGAAEAVGRQRPDIVVLDVRLPDGSGLTGLAEMVGGGLLVLVGQPDVVAELVRRDLGDVLDAVDEVVRGVRLTRALDERDGVVGGRRLGRLGLRAHCGAACSAKVPW